MSQKLVARWCAVSANDIDFAISIVNGGSQFMKDVEKIDIYTCVYALKQNQAVLKHLLAQSREDIAVSVITEAELRTGAAKSTSGARTLRLIETFLRPLGIVEFTSSDAASCAQLRAKLGRAGTPIGPLDTLMAAQAVAANSSLFQITRVSLAELGPPP